jgi:hypothetical protein
MIRRSARIVLVLSLALALIIPPPSALACGPFFLDTIFIQRKHPDVPFEKYAAGSLGVVQPTYGRSFLVVAYRYFSGTPFDSSEQEQLLSLWAHRYQREDVWLKEKNKNVYQQWLEARFAYAEGVKPAPLKDSNDDQNAFPGYSPSSSGYYQFQNCAPDAFLTAAKTLQARSQQFGQHSTEVRSWLDAQDTVFDNCGGPTSATSKLPEEAPKQLPAILRADREYQIAAAYFYEQNWSEAEQRFRDISQDSSSPWQAIAAIVTLRTRLRKITLSDDPPESHQKDLAEIDGQLRDLEKMPSMHELRPAIWRMRGFVEFRLDPNARRLELADILERAKQRSTLRDDLNDYTQLFDRVMDQRDDPASNPQSSEQASNNPASAKQLSGRTHSQLTDWLLTFQASDEDATAHALSRWNETHSLPWLVASLDKAAPKTPRLSELLEAAAKIQPNSPAYLTVAFHRARLQAESGNEDAARQTIKPALDAASANASPSALNIFFALRTKLARNLDDFLDFSQRRPSVVTYNVDERDLPDELCNSGNSQYHAPCKARPSPPPLFDADSATVLTQGLPTRILVQAASSSRLPASLRRQVAESAWVRAILLNDDPSARQLAPILSSLSPNLVPGLKGYLEANDSTRRFAAIFLILHQPELHPYISAGIGRQTPPGEMDSFHDNWWCSFTPPTDQGGWGNYYSNFTRMDGPLRTVYSEKKLYYPAFLTEAQKKTAEKEWTDLSKIETAPNWLAARILVFAKANPDDPRVPEALHQVVRATHLGCTDAGTTEFSKAAFQLLHKRYADDEWTKKTPYWY